MYEIISKRLLNSNEIYRMEIHAPWISLSGKPGQFVIVIPNEKGERIPLTISDIVYQRQSIVIVFQVVGETTRQLAAMNEGDDLYTIVGPLGKPSELIEKHERGELKRLMFVAGGVGIAPVFPQVKWAFEALNELFLRITMMIIKFIPLAIFASILNLVLNTGYDALLDLVNFMLCYFVSLSILLVLYMLVVLLLGHLNPFTFLRKYLPTFVMALSINSSSAMMPHNMRVCKENFGVSEKVYSLSIPLGATLNMAGGATYLVLSTLFLARLYGVEIPSSLYLPMSFSIFVLSAGAPGVAGAAFICLAVMLSQLNIPAEAIGILMGIDAIMSMFRTAFNTTGDVAVTLAVANSEGKLDLATYNS